MKHPRLFEYQPRLNSKKLNVFCAGNSQNLLHFYDGCFAQPTYHWGLFCDSAKKVFEFADISQLSWATLHLQEADNIDQKLVELFWLAEFLEVPGDSLMTLILQYRESKTICFNSHFNQNVINQILRLRTQMKDCVSRIEEMDTCHEI